MKPRELHQAELLMGMLERFGGYTLKTLREEDAELIQLLQIEALGREEISS